METCIEAGLTGSGCKNQAAKKTEKITIMVGRNESTRIQNTIGILFPMSGLGIEETSAGVEVTGAPSDIQQVKDMLNGKIVDKVATAIRSLKRLQKKHNGNMSHREIRNADARVNNLILLASKKDWY